ncbi:hypothetical protein GMRT_15087 [Giardia muris]|uniref:Catenin family protein n=1 Tax=Giardia muris TaxID=5742 RepID=A0A4Z1SMZ6_GIAMU|nr:hypothetical protein GMRT_15087 [Giardia muris]|eukprot:TNJ26960.1 hypothetical protein GMRT_15087 [Giardia muris]
MTKPGSDFYGTTPLGGIFRARSQSTMLLQASRGTSGGRVQPMSTQPRNRKGADDIITIEAFPELSDEEELSPNSESEGDLEYDNCPPVQLDDGRHGAPSVAPSSSNLFVRMVQAINDNSGLQAILAVATLKSTDFKVLKTRQLFLTAGGISALLRVVSSVSLVPLKQNDTGSDKIFRSDPKLAYESLFVLAALADIARDARKTIMSNDGIKIALSVVRAQFSPHIPFVAGIRARALRMIAGCLLDADCRRATRRIGGVQLLIATTKQAIKDYQAKPTPEQGSILFGAVAALDSMMASFSCREVFRAESGISLFVQIASDMPLSFPITDDMTKLTADAVREGNSADFLFETVTNTLRTLSQSPAGRQDIHHFGGIPKVCTLLQKTQSARVRQRSVAILANCAQDPGVDSAVRKAGGLAVLSSLLTSQDVDTLLSACKTIVLVCRSGPYFGSYEDSIVYNAHNGYLSFNARNDENILALVRYKSITNLSPHIEVSLDVLGVGENPSSSLIVTAKDDEKTSDVTVVLAKQKRLLVLSATRALAPLLSSKEGRAAFKATKALFSALLAHITVADPEIITATCFALSTGAEGDPELCKQIAAQDGLKKLWSLIKHPNILVVTAVARALVPLLYDKSRAQVIGRQINGSLEQLSVLLKCPTVIETSTDDIVDDAYRAYLTLECKGWLVGLVAELCKDEENARILTEYGLVPVVCDLTMTYATPDARADHPYAFYVYQLIREKCALALSTISCIESNMNAIADYGAIPAVVRLITSTSGVSVFDPAVVEDTTVIGGPVVECTNQYGSYVNFTETPATLDPNAPVDQDPQGTSNPYIITNRAAAIALSELSKNKKCAVLFRQCGAIYGLLTLIGSTDARTQEAASSALKNIRQMHIACIEAYTRRMERQLATINIEKNMDSVVSIPLVKAAVETIYNDLEFDEDECGSPRAARRQMLRMFRQAARQGIEPNDPTFLKTAMPKSSGSLNCGQSLQVSVLTAPKRDPQPRVQLRTPGRLTISDLNTGTSPIRMMASTKDFVQLTGSDNDASAPGDDEVYRQETPAEGYGRRPSSTGQVETDGIMDDDVY